MTAMGRTLRARALMAADTRGARRPPPKPTAAHLRDESFPACGGLEAELAELERLSLEDLRLRWRNHWGRLGPAHLSRNLLFRLMAYRLQAETFGELDRETIRVLERLAEAAADKSASDRSSSAASDGSLSTATEPTRQVGDPLILKPGTLLVREWQGRLEHVTVVHDGFAWNGASYRSLSAVAFAITGTKWSGHRFFGVRPQDRVRANRRSGDRGRRSRNQSAGASASDCQDNEPFAEHGSPVPLLGATSDLGESVQ